MTLRVIIFSVFSLILFSCTDNQPSEKKATEKFAENADDKDFQKQHETPKEIDFSPQGIKLEVPTLDGKQASG